MNQRLHPGVIALALGVTVVLVALMGWSALKSPPTGVGIKRDGSPMTEADGQAMKRAMTGGGSRRPDDASKAAEPERR